MNASEKITKARAQLVLDSPFFGSLILRLELVKDDLFPTMWTDGKKLGYSSRFVDSLAMDELKGVLCHEVMHLACNHQGRRDDRDHRDWNMSGDYAINGIIRKEFKLPDGHLFNPDWKDLSAEQIYPLVCKEREDEKKGDGQGSGEGETGQGQGQGQGGESDRDENKKEKDPGGCGAVRDSGAGQENKPVSQAEKSKMAADWKVNLSQALQQAKSMGSVPGGMSRVVEKLINPKVDWRQLLSRFMDRAAKSDYSWCPPNRRHVYNNVYLPSCSNKSIGVVVIGVDTSGSIDDRQLKQFAAEVSVILSDLQAECFVVYCDTKVHSYEHFLPGEAVYKLKAQGGGGTDFVPVFNWVRDNNINPSCLIYLTDMHGRFPDKKDCPPFPVMWVTETIGKNVPFGEVVVIR